MAVNQGRNFVAGAAMDEFEITEIGEFSISKAVWWSSFPWART
jgi:hypothetical protein